jgi:hypothetical protein
MQGIRAVPLITALSNNVNQARLARLSKVLSTEIGGEP